MNILVFLFLGLISFCIILILLNSNSNTKCVEMKFDIPKIMSLDVKTEYQEKSEKKKKVS